MSQGKHRKLFMGEEEGGHSHNPEIVEGRTLELGRAELEEILVEFKEYVEEIQGPGSDFRGEVEQIVDKVVERLKQQGGP